MATCKECFHWGFCERGDDKSVCDDFKNKADFVEVKRGKWKEHFAYGCWYYDCPFCDDGYAIEERQIRPENYCHNCGAKLDGKEAAERGGEQ